MNTKIIRQSITFKTTPDKVYEAYFDSRVHSKFTGSKARLSKKLGAEYSVYDGYATGKNLEIVPNEIIRQSWRASNWPEDFTSEIRIEMEPTHIGTKITFTHKGVPENEYESLKKGWIDFYWNPMKKLLNDK